MYFGGVAPSLRKEVWPFLLGHYKFSMSEKCRREVLLMCFSIKIYSHAPIYSLPVIYTCLLLQIDEQMRCMYEQTMKEWQGCEAIVRQREREKHAEALARCSSGASVERGPVQRDSTISTDASLNKQKNPHYVTPTTYYFKSCEKITWLTVLLFLSHVILCLTPVFSK